jgi:coenzyme PQQ synthesis protein D (PqqD)
VTEQRWRQGEDVAARRLEDEVVLVNLLTNHIYSLNATGSRVWELLDVPRTRDELVNALVEEFDVEQTTLERETDELLASLAAANLVLTDGD